MHLALHRRKFTLLPKAQHKIYKLKAFNLLSLDEK
jgi:hypothetical protein